jgi:histidyl-tRNA synthetase
MPWSRPVRVGMTSMEKIQSVRGMKDILPQETWMWQRVEDAYRRVMALYNYREIRIPLLEKTALFARSIGEETDIVKKEMYTFIDQGGEDLSLRPEGTAGVVRAYIQHSLSVQEPVSKFYYIGPMFRRERPQKGRYRQFYQAGAEIFGAPEPIVDIELIIMLRDFFGQVGLGEVTFICNHLGTPESRRLYTQELAKYFNESPMPFQLCEDCQRRLVTNPLRILDCKQHVCREFIARSPSIESSRPESSSRDFDRFVRGLADAGVEVRIEPRLVRGLDYYTGIIFEGVTAGPEGEEGGQAVVGGGRYDGLVGQLGGPETAAVGYAIGLERMIDLCRKSLGGEKNLEIFIASVGMEAGRMSMKLLQELRGRGWSCDFDPRGGSLKSQMKRADKSAARFVLVLGEEEVRSATVKLRDMQSGEQADVSMDDLCNILEKKLTRLQ